MTTTPAPTTADATAALPRCTSEQAAHAMLALVGDHPGSVGRLRCARIVGGYTVPYRDQQQAADLERYARRLEWPLREITRLVDALTSGGLLTQTEGPRPVLVLTRAGHRALDALDTQHTPNGEDE